MNLLDNAIKYSPDGALVRIRVGRDAAGGWITFEDQGLGIAVEDRDRVFERFYRVDKARSGSREGPAAFRSKWAVEAHEGRIELDSEVVGAALPDRAAGCAALVSGRVDGAAPQDAHPQEARA